MKLIATQKLDGVPSQLEPAFALAKSAM